MANEVIVKLKKISALVYEIYGVLNGRFVKRQYVGYTQKQAVKAFTESVKRGEI